MSTTPLEIGARDGAPPVPDEPSPIQVARSPGQVVWLRLTRDLTGLVSGVICLLLIVVAVAAPVIEVAYGIGPRDTFTTELDRYGMPSGWSTSPSPCPF
jgi:peptide/nickel transport system permease protein